MTCLSKFPRFNTSFLIFSNKIWMFAKLLKFSRYVKFIRIPFICENRYLYCESYIISRKSKIDPFNKQSRIIFISETPCSLWFQIVKLSITKYKRFYMVIIAENNTHYYKEFIHVWIKRGHSGKGTVIHETDEGH